MKVINTMPRSIRIEGIMFTPAKAGVTVPKGKESKVKKDFFFKHYVDEGSFIVKDDSFVPKEEVKETKKIDILGD